MQVGFKMKRAKIFLSDTACLCKSRLHTLIVSECVVFEVVFLEFKKCKFSLQRDRVLFYWINFKAARGSDTVTTRSSPTTTYCFFCVYTAPFHGALQNLNSNNNHFPSMPNANIFKIGDSLYGMILTANLCGGEKGKQGQNATISWLAGQHFPKKRWQMRTTFGTWKKALGKLQYAITNDIHPLLNSEVIPTTASQIASKKGHL